VSSEDSGQALRFRYGGADFRGHFKVLLLIEKMPLIIFKGTKTIA
jgi:hypothetical protein